MYEIQEAATKDRLWIHGPDGSTVGRFGLMGIDLHNSITEQLNGAPQCRLCTPGPATLEHWELFREKAKEWWGVDVPVDAINTKLLSKGN